MKTLAPATLAALLLALPALAEPSAEPHEPSAESAAAAAPARNARVIPVRAEAPVLRTFERRVRVQGTLRSATYADVSARVDGIIDEMFVDEGDTVSPGDPLFQIDPTRTRAALVIASNDLSVAQANLLVAQAAADKVKAEARKAQLDFQRFTRLHDDKKVTDNEYEAAEVASQQALAAIAVADAQVVLASRQADAASAALDIARKNHDDTLVRAPIAGAISSRRAEPGEMAAAGRVLLRIDDLSAVEAAAYVPARYYPDAAPSVVSFRLFLAGRDCGTFPLSYRSPTINPTLRTFEIKGPVSGPDAIPGAEATLELVFETREGLSVPSSAILSRADGKAIFLAEGPSDAPVARLLPVTVGLQNDGYAEILTPLPPDALVITHGQTLLNSGDPISLLP